MTILVLQDLKVVVDTQQKKAMDTKNGIIIQIGFGVVLKYSILKLRQDYLNIQKMVICVF